MYIITTPATPLKHWKICEKKDQCYMPENYDLNIQRTDKPAKRAGPISKYSGSENTLPCRH